MHLLDGPALPDEPTGPDDGREPAVERGERRRPGLPAWLRNLPLAARVVGALVVIGLVSAWLLRADANALQQHLVAAEQDFRVARSALTTADVEAARSALDDARADLDAAARRADGPLWATARMLPLIGPSARTAGNVLDLTDAAHAVAVAAVEQGDTLLGDGLVESIVRDDGGIDLDRVRELAGIVDDLPMEQLTAARAALVAEDPTTLLASLRGGYADVLRLTDDTIRTVDDAAAMLDVLPGFLGADGRRDYLLLLQNPGEMRGTGGFPGFLIRISAVDGRIQLGTSGNYDPLAEDPNGQDVTFDRGTQVFAGVDSVKFDDFVPRADDYAARYDHTASAAFFGSTTIDPDLPTSGPIVLGMYEKIERERLDGVILADSLALQMVLEAIGPLDLPDDVLPSVGQDPDGLITDPLPAARVNDVALIHAYNVFGGISPERTRFQQGMAFAAFERLFGGGWPDPVAVANAVGEATASRHIQLYSEDPDEQAAFEEVGVAGTFGPRDDADFLAVTQVNASGDKSDILMSLSATATIRLDEPRTDDGRVVARREVAVEVEHTNPMDLTSGLDDYFIGTYPPQPLGEPRGRRVQDALNRTWFTVWGPAGSAVREAVDADGNGIVVGDDDYRGMRPLDHYLETEAGTSNRFRVALAGDVELGWDGTTATYELYWRRQPKGIAEQVRVSIEAPEGWVIVGADLDGGQGPWIGTPPPAPTVVVAGTSVDVAFMMTRDATIEVRLQRE